MSITQTSIVIEYQSKTNYILNNVFSYDRRKDAWLLFIKIVLAAFFTYQIPRGAAMSNVLKYVIKIIPDL